MIMNRLVEEAKKAIDAILEQRKSPLKVLEELEEVFEHIDIAIDDIQDHLCQEEV